MFAGLIEDSFLLIEGFLYELFGYPFNRRFRIYSFFFIIILAQYVPPGVDVNP